MVEWNYQQENEHGTRYRERLPQAKKRGLTFERTHATCSYQREVANS